MEEGGQAGGKNSEKKVLSCDWEINDTSTNMAHTSDCVCGWFAMESPNMNL